MPRPRKPVILYCADGARRSEVAFVMQSQLSIAWIASSAESEGISRAAAYPDAACLVLLRDRDDDRDRAALSAIEALMAQLPEMRVIDVHGAGSAAQEFPAAARVLTGPSMALLLESVRLACARKRGPKKRLVVELESRREAA